MGFCFNRKFPFVVRKTRLKNVSACSVAGITLLYHFSYEATLCLQGYLFFTNHAQISCVFMLYNVEISEPRLNFQLFFYLAISSCFTQ